MSQYYLVAYPETIVDLITRGSLPDLPSYIKNKHLICRKNITDLSQDIVNSSHQIFIIELNIPNIRDPSQFYHEEPDTNPNGFMIAKTISKDWLTKIIVYSQRAHNLLKNLLNKTSSQKITNLSLANLPIKQDPDFPPFQAKHMPNSLKASNNSNSSQEKKTIAEDKSCPTEPTVIFSIPKNSPQKNSGEKKQFKELVRLSTVDEHITILKKALLEAKYNIMITSYSINHKTMQSANLYYLFPQALSRGVKIYIYYNDSNEIDKSILDFFDSIGILCDKSFTHSKLLVVDQYFICVGSFNWLSAIDEKFGSSDEASLLYTGTACKLMKEDFWKHLIHYRNEQFGNTTKTKEFENNFSNLKTLSYNLGNGTSLEYLPTLEQHDLFLQNCFLKAKERIIVCSPFISSGKEFEKGINTKIVLDALKRGVQIIFVCLSNSESLWNLIHYFSSINATGLKVITANKFHLKTVIVDSTLIAEGSFNWFSAVRDKESIYHNHEVTWVTHGERSQNLISDFFCTRMGKIVQHHLSKPNDSQGSNSFKPLLAEPPPKLLLPSIPNNNTVTNKNNTGKSNKRKLGNSGSEDLLQQREQDLAVSSRKRYKKI